MDFGSIILIIVVLAVIGLVLLKYLQNLPKTEDSTLYSSGILAAAKKAEKEADDKAFAEKKDLEQNWRFGIRMLRFMEHLKESAERPAGWSIAELPDPYDRAVQLSYPAMCLDFESEEGSCRLILYDKYFSPDWLKKIDASAFFRVLEIYDAKGVKVFRALLRFLVQEGAEIFSGTVLEVFEPGSWVPPLRTLLTQSENERGVDHRKL